MPERCQLSPWLDPQPYTEAFGKLCGRINVRPGVQAVRFTNNAVVRDAGLPDACEPNA